MISQNILLRTMPNYSPFNSTLDGLEKASTELCLPPHMTLPPTFHVINNVNYEVN